MNYSLKEKRDSKSAVVVARMVPQKNFQFILKLLSELPEINKLVWVGDGHQKGDIINYASQLNIADRIDFKGVIPRAEVYEVLTKSSIYIAASKWEGIGVANIESAALGCIPFLSDIPPHNEIASEIGISTYSLSDTSEWSLAIRELFKMSDSDLMDRRVSIAEATLGKYDLMDAVNKYIIIYRDYLCESKTKS